MHQRSQRSAGNIQEKDQRENARAPQLISWRIWVNAKNSQKIVLQLTSEDGNHQVLMTADVLRKMGEQFIKTATVKQNKEKMKMN